MCKELSVQDIRIGEELKAIKDNGALKKGDIITVRTIGKSLFTTEERDHIGYNPSFFEKATKYPYPPHPHAEVIKAWADGAEIELKLSNGDWVGNSVSPSFCLSRQYRIKPEKSEKQLKIEELEKKARELADEIATLKGE